MVAGTGLITQAGIQQRALQLGVKVTTVAEVLSPRTLSLLCIENTSVHRKGV